MMKKIYAIVLLLFVIAGCKKETLIKEPELVQKSQEIKGEIVQLGSITVVKKDGQYILGGDIILSEAQVSYLQNFKPNKPGSKGTKSTFVADFGKLWPNGIVYYTVRSDVYNTQIITDGIAHYESNTTLTFVPRTNQTNYVEFIPITGNVAYAEYGMVGGKQEIKLPAASGTSTVIHEIGHTIGLMHEMSRGDRDGYVNIYPANMVTNALPNFQKYTDLGIAGGELGPYDFDSVMGYESPFLGINSSYTSTTKNGGYIFYNYVLSAGDIDGINYLYDNANYKKIYVRWNTANYVDNSGYSTYNDYDRIDYDVTVEFYEDFACTIPYTLTKAVNVKLNPFIGWDVQSYEPIRYFLIPSGVQSYKVGETHIEVDREFGNTVRDASYGTYPVSNHGYIGVNLMF